MDDSLFREMFTLQILIFSHSIIDPIGVEHKALRKMSEEEEKLIRQLQVKAAKLLTGSGSTKAKHEKTVLGKRPFGESIVQVVQSCEPQWSNWKKQGCQSFEVRATPENSIRGKLEKHR